MVRVADKLRDVLVLCDGQFLFPYLSPSAELYHILCITPCRMLILLYWNGEGV